jgi:hypothetical protein
MYVRHDVRRLCVYSMYVRHDVCSDMGYVCSLCMYSIKVSQCTCSIMKGVGSGWRDTGESVADRQIGLKSKSQLIAHACFVFWKKTCFTRINDDLVE